jgi:hypothetical protein
MFPDEIWVLIMNSAISAKIICAFYAVNHRFRAILKDMARENLAVNYVRYILQKCGNRADDEIWINRALYYGYAPLIRDFAEDINNDTLIICDCKTMIHRSLIDILYKCKINVFECFVDLYNIYKIYHNQYDKVIEYEGNISTGCIMVALDKYDANYGDIGDITMWAFEYGRDDLFFKINDYRMQYGEGERGIIPNKKISAWFLEKYPKSIYHFGVMSDTITCEELLMYYISQRTPENIILARISGEFVVCLYNLRLIVVCEYYEVAKLYIGKENYDDILRWVESCEFTMYIRDKYQSVFK